MLKRTDWRALQWTEDDASESIQLEFLFARRRSKRLIMASTGITRLTSPITITIRAKHS